MGTRLRKLKLVYSKKKLSDGKTIGGKGRLTDSLIDKLAHYYGNAIRCNSTSVKKCGKPFGLFGVILAALMMNRCTGFVLQIQIHACKEQKSNRYANAELVDIHFIYGLANEIGRVVVHLYVERYPMRRPPNNQTFARVHQNLVEHTSLSVRIDDIPANSKLDLVARISIAATMICETPSIFEHVQQSMCVGVCCVKGRLGTGGVCVCDGQVGPDVRQGTMAPWARRLGGEGSSKKGQKGGRKRRTRKVGEITDGGNGEETRGEKPGEDGRERGDGKKTRKRVRDWSGKRMNASGVENGNMN
ncbi:hypothetical protein TNCV_3134061 [Trichonephila clavipes]|nr:hypothetical protein TNCV_3134061 [Trichonephila clavipes]